MAERWTANRSPLRYTNPFVKAYVLLFTFVTVAFFSGIPLLGFVTFLSVVVTRLSRIPLKLIWNNIRFYVLVLYPAFVGLLLLEGRHADDAMTLGALLYLRFMNVILAGTIFGLTSSSFDSIVLAFRFHWFRNLGLALSAAFMTSLLFERKIRDVFAFQRLRGVRFSLDPRHFWKNVHSMEALLLPIILTAVDLAENINIGLVSRGWDPLIRPTLPRYITFSRWDVLALLAASIFMLLLTFR